MTLAVRQMYSLVTRLDNQETIEFVSIKKRIARGKTQGLSIDEIIYGAKRDAVIRKLMQERGK